MNRFHFSWLFGLVLATTPGCDRTVGVDSVDGQSCAEGDTKLADDGCNQCSCGTDGTWACTEMACLGTGGSTGVGGATGVGGSIGVGGGAICCLALPICADGALQISGPDACIAGAECHESTMCCTTIWCMKPTAQCEAMPVCDAGDTEITGTCPPDGSCYERTLCGTTINCRRSTVQPCPIGAVRQSDTDCNTETCVAGGWSTTLVYCPLSCTAGSTKPSTDGCNTCTCSADGTWGCSHTACPAIPCATGQASYQGYRAGMLKWATACKTDADCTLVYESNRCSTTCGTAVATASAEYFGSELSTVAAANCASCPEPAMVDCLAVAAVCEAGTCVTKVQSGM